MPNCKVIFELRKHLSQTSEHRDFGILRWNRISNIDTGQYANHSVLVMTSFFGEGLYVNLNSNQICFIYVIGHIDNKPACHLKSENFSRYFTSHSGLKGLLIFIGKFRLPKAEPQDRWLHWTVFPCYWPFVRGIHRSLVNSPHKSQCHGALMGFFICTWTDG